MSISLLINSLINDELKFNHFKITFSDIFEYFDEIHIKLRGSYKNKCIEYITNNFNIKKLFMYQNLEEDDWVASTYKIVMSIKTNNIFLYNEDHKLNCSKYLFNRVINEFNKNKIDFMNYSFFNASKLSSKNILPLNPTQGKLINYFDLDNNKLKIIGICNLYLKF